MSNKEFNPNGVIPDNGNYFGFPVEPNDAALVLLSAPWDATTSMRVGSSYAPDAIIEASRRIDLYDPVSPDSWRKGVATAPIDYTIQDLSLNLHSDAERVMKLHDELGMSVLENIIYTRSLRRVNEGMAEMNKNIYAQSAEWVNKGKIVGLVGGDQSTSYGLVKAIGQKYGEFGMLHIDSKVNLRDKFCGFDFSYASIMHDLLRDVEQIKSLVSVGVREFSPIEWQRAQENERVKLFTGQQIWSSHFEGVNWSTICNQIIAELPEKVYIALDIDGLTMDCSPHTGTIISGGLRFPEVVYLLDKLVNSGRQIVGFDLSGVVPCHNDKVDALVAARLLFKMCGISLKGVQAPDIL
ncbi:MAG: arginase family protein [Alistipes sp.]|nr:arginase family protein [Alistipes sp.]